MIPLRTLGPGRGVGAAAGRGLVFTCGAAARAARPWLRVLVPARAAARRRDRCYPARVRACAGDSQSSLLDLDGRAGSFELLLDLARVFLGHVFLDRVRHALDQRLGLLEAEAGERADLLDHVDLLFAE